MSFWLILVLAQEPLLPLLAKQCGACHTGKQAQGGLSMDSIESLKKGGKHGAALTPGVSGESLLLQYVTGEKTPRMPLGSELDAKAVGDLRAAIDAMPKGAAVSKRDAHLEWLLKKPGSVAVPEVAQKSWLRNPIDAFVLAGLEKQGMKPAAEASRRVLLRRIYFDLIGVPPSPEEMKNFEADTDPLAYEKAIDRLLADSRYGERWGRHWLDLVRYAESDGFAIDGERPTAWRYRDYVIRAHNQDKPYNVFVQEQLAGDEGKSKNQVALGFYRFAPWEADANSKKLLRQDFLNDITSTVGSVFLGMTTGCAQCHDHKYDPISHKDYYRLQAFFAGTAIADLPAGFEDAERPKEMRRKMREHEDAAEAGQVELEKQKEALKQKYLSLNKDEEGLKKFLGKLNTRNLFFLEQDLPLVKEPEWREPLQRYFETRDGVQREQELARRHQAIAYAIRDVAPPAAPEIPDTYVLTGGDLNAKGEKVKAGFLSCVAGTEPAEIPFAGGSNGLRLALSDWIASGQNPFTARVMVNRIWQRHWGEGLVRTPSDLGKNGDVPSHPELLDWMANEFIAKGWSMKAMHKLMLTSATYRQASVNAEQTKYAAKDPTNRLLWRMNWQRLDAEVLRDSILSISGRLNPEMGGPPVVFDVPADVAQGFEFFKWFPSSEEQQRRRSVYLLQRRSVLLPMAETFDAPNLSTSCARRLTTIVAPQALTLLNGALTRTEAKHFEARLAGAKDAVNEAFWLALGRGPTAEERRMSEKLSLSSLGVVLFNLNEFLFVE